jgi:hypothetical protein
MTAIPPALERSHRLRSGHRDDFRVQSHRQLIDQSRPQQERVTQIMRGIAVAALLMGSSAR